MFLASSLGAAMIVAVTSVSLAGNVGVSPDLRQKAQAACTDDALRLCPDAMGDNDEEKVVACMKPQRAKMTATCRQVYDQVAKALKQ